MRKGTDQNDAEPKLALLSVPEAARKLVVVADDFAVEAARRAEREKRNGGMDEADWAAVAARAVSIEFGSILLAGELVGAAVAAGVKVWKQARKLERDAGVPVLTVGRSEVAGAIFPPGHPRDGVLYVLHPAAPTCYYTVAEFHRRAFEHKVCEAIRMLMALGTTVIEVEHQRGWSRDFASHLSVPLGKAGVDVGAEAGKTSGRTDRLLYRATLDGNAQPRLPTGMVWYPHEPTWQVIAEGRLDAGLRQFSLTVHYEDDYGINAGLKVKAGKTGLDLGGSFEDHVATVWQISGEFNPRK